MVLSKKELGALVKEARKIKSEKIEKLYTQRMLANDLKKSQSYIGDIESGRTYPSFIFLTQIAEACGVPINFFQDDERLNDNIERFIKSRLSKVKDEDLSHIIEHIKNDPDLDMDYIRSYLENNLENEISVPYDLFRNPEEALKFLLKQSTMVNFLGINIAELTENELSEFTTDLLNQLKLISYKYKK